MMKKSLLFISLLFFCVSSSFAIKQKAMDVDSSFEDDMPSMGQEVKDQKDVSSLLKKTKKYYYEGKFDKAESCINEILAVSLDNEKANELRNKILLVKEKEQYYKKILVNDYYIELRRTIKEGNYYEGFLFIKKIKALAPEENLDSFYNRLVSEKEIVLSTMESKGDKNLFLKSIDAFVDEKFSKSTRLIYKLYEKYPKFVDFVGVSRYHIIKETNNKRVSHLYKKALKYLKSNKLGKARTYAEMAYCLQQENVNLKVLIEQINMEII